MNTTDEREAIEACRRESRKQSWPYRPGIFRERFVSPFEQYAERIGQRFVVVHTLCKQGEEVYDDEGNVIDHLEMYRIRFEDGMEIDAWGEEACVPTAHDSIE